MANLLGMIVTWLTFPGVILHEWSHKFLCDRAGVPVYEVKYFSFGNPAGYVRHGEITRYRDVFLITIAPFIINTIFALIMFIIPSFKIAGIFNLFFTWLGLSLAMHAFPSDGDAKDLWEHSKRTWRANPIALIGIPLVGIIIIANLLRIFWFDLIYAGFLFSITFGLVSFAFFGGSLAFFGAPAAGTTNPYTYPAAGEVPTNVIRPTAVQSIAGQEAPAKDWLSIAQNAMKEKNSNAVLISVDGHSDDRGIALPLNGKCHWWQYTYASRADNMVYYVTVHDSVLEGIKTKAFSTTGMEGILYKYGDPTIDSWGLDSVDVVKAAYDKYKEQGGQEPASAGYRLQLNCWGSLSWTIFYYDSTSRVTANINVDPATGSLGNVWIPAG